MGPPRDEGNSFCCTEHFSKSLLFSTPAPHLALLPGRASLSSLVSALGWEKGLEESKRRGRTLEMEQGKLFKQGKPERSTIPSSVGQ